MGLRDAVRISADGDGDALRQRLRRRRSSDRCALHAPLSHAPQFARRPDLAAHARQAFLSETAGIRCERFVLASGDLVILGEAGLADRLDSPLRRLFTLAASGDTDAAPLPKVGRFDLANPDDGNALAALATAGGAPVSAPGRGLTPADVGGICTRLSATSIADLIRTQTAVALAAGTSRPLLQEAYVTMDELRRRFAPGIETSGRPLFRYLLEAIDRQLLRFLPALADLRADIPISVNLSLNTLSTPEFAAFRRANPCRAPLFVELHIVDVLTAPAAFESLRARLQGAGVMLIVDGIPLSVLDHIDLSSLRPAPVKVLWDQGRDAGAVAQRIPVLRRAASRIGAENLILARCDSESAIACALGAGVTRVQGRLVERLLAKGPPA